MHGLKGQIRVTSKNSKVVNDKLFVSLSKIFTLKKIIKEKLNHDSQINHPLLGRMVEYTGPYIRRVI